MFISRSEAFKFAVGDVITLPCEVTHPGSFVLAWKRGIAILTAGQIKVSPDPRVRLVNGYTLQIRDAVPSDAGDYICQIGTLEPREITHHVEILIPPKINHVTSGGHLQVKKGSPVRLECSASGNPMPNITWTRKNNLLPNGEEKFVSSNYVIENMDRHKGGTYICTANNGVGQTASSQIALHVLYPPEIVVENAIVYSGEGQEATLSCIVHGETQPEVSWLRDTMPIDQHNEHYAMENRGTRNTLTIRRVKSQDFGNYSCVADNQLGKNKKIITLSGLPRAPQFRSNAQSQWRDKYNISWTVDSYAPIEEYKLYYKMLTHNSAGFQNHLDASMDTKNVDSYPSHANYKDNSNTFDSFSSYSNGYGVYHRPTTDWIDLVLQPYPFSTHYTQGMSYTIKNLEPDQQYEAKVIARNRYGWSDFSERFVFSTSLIDTEARDMEVKHYTSTSSSVFISWRLLILVLNLKFAFFVIHYTRFQRLD
ncbi:CLUMA_CG011111, isoform A [Clunio marinus]|uniref:CLUMA_CG011111, isoform A n=1 Tax=Clunio marinus TaxID=568069 RepID=A0A1J1IC03_9DIPT|nr:CLUMA_CG011111, isoform A [Clunio marinus]